MYKAKPMIRLLLGSSAFDPEDKSAGLLNRISQRQGFVDGEFLETESLYSIDLSWPAPRDSLFRDICTSVQRMP